MIAYAYICNRKIISMDKLIKAFPQQILESLEIAAKAKFSTPKNPIHQVVICGMGGSGIGGKIASQWVIDEIPVPIILHSDYGIPHFVNANSLVVCSSYSGNTEETLSSLEEAHQKGAHIIGVCSGGKLMEFCKNNGYQCVALPGGNPPRAALAYSLIQLVNILAQHQLISPNHLDNIRQASSFLLSEQIQIEAEGKEIASFLLGKVGVIYAGPFYEGVAVRARQQFNENSKTLAICHVIPEMNHNELLGWEGGDDRFAVLFLNSSDLDPRNAARFAFTKTFVSGKTSFVKEAFAKGSNRIERSLYLIHLVDWASFYIADLKQIDAVDITVIEALKKELAAI
jgi:glucose/mannose-6-phosphate isomerase